MSASVHKMAPRVLDWRAEAEALDARLAQLAGVAPPEPADLPDWEFASLAEAFSLDAFEQRALLFLAMCELRQSTRAMAGKFGSGPPSVGLVLNVCGSEGRWEALSPQSALRRGHLVELSADPGPFTEQGLHLSEAVLHALHGQRRIDHVLMEQALILPDRTGEQPCAQALQALHACLTVEGRSAPLVEVLADDPHTALVAARQALADHGLGVVALAVEALPADAAALDALQSIWLRDAILHRLGLALVGNGAPVPVERVTGWGTPVLVIGAPVPAAASPMRCVLEAGGSGQAELWRGALGEGKFGDLADRLGFQFRIAPASIAAIAGGHDEPDDIWRAAVTAARPRDAGLLERIEPRITLGDVILPDETAEILQAAVTAGRGQHRVARDWQTTRGMGVTVLFSGDSGTGKTMAAEAIAHALGLDLYRVELSAVVSKYIGETERNLRRVFTAVADAGGVLLFDEADALFGKRSEVKDSHDRYANLEVGYLLQQMEAYRGIAILTTNMPDALDDAFTRRLRFVARFPLPGVKERERIWQRAFPESVACEKMAFKKLAKLSLTGALIRNIALGASFRAAGDERAVTMSDVIASARLEFIKLDRELSEIVGRDWG